MTANWQLCNNRLIIFDLKGEFFERILHQKTEAYMTFKTDTTELRKVYCDGLIALAQQDERIVVLDADLMRANGTLPFQAAFAERTFDVGVAEANMIGVAAGLAACGKIPFANSFTAFATRRCFDQITISVAYAKLPVKICGTDAGLSAQMNGGTHMSLEDVSLMRSLPNMAIFEPTDETQLRQAMPQIAAYDGPMYIRLFRREVETIFDENYRFVLGKADTLKEGRDVVIFATGIMVWRSLEAAEQLAAMGIDAAVVNIHTLRPLDRDAVLTYAAQCGAVVTAENHSVTGGLGSAVCELLAENEPVPVERIGVRDSFGAVGKLGYLAKKFNMEPGDIVAAAKKAISRKA